MAREDDIGSMRWPVRLRINQQTPNMTTGITEIYEGTRTVYADVRPVGAITLYLGQQLGNELTHRIAVRWIDYANMVDYVFRDTTLQDGTVRTERFRVRRAEEIEGRKRFVALFCELERFDNP